MKQLVIILDACRFDILKTLLPRYTSRFLLYPIYSGSHNTPEYYQNITFVNDYVLVTANPTPLYHKQEHKWKRVIHTKSIHPDDNLKECLEILRTEERVVLHLIPPHIPWQGEKGKLKWEEMMEKLKFSMNLSPRQRSFGPLNIEEEIYKRFGNEVRFYYEENLNLALQAVFKYYPKLPKPFILTADHGELLGEDGLFGHTDKSHYILATIPIAVIY